MGWFFFGVAAWAACGIYGAGVVFAYFQRKWPTLRHEGFIADQMTATLALVAGPCNLIALIGRTGYGWLWPWGDVAKREAGMV